MGLRRNQIANAIFVAVFILVLLAPHLTRGFLESTFAKDASDSGLGWATKPVAHLVSPKDNSALIDGSYARAVDEHMKETLFSRYLTAVGNEVLYSSFETFRRPWIRGSDGWVFWQSGLDHVARIHNQAETQIRIEGMAAMLELVQLCLSSKGVETVVVTIPKKASLCSEFLPRGRHEREADGFVDPVWEQLMDACRRHKVNAIDMRPHLRELIGQGEFPFFKKGTHLAPAGIKEVSNMVAAKIRQDLPTMKDRVGDPSEVEIVARQHTTDAAYLMGFRTNRDCGPEFRFELEREEYPHAKLNVLKDAEVALAGTSFSSRYGDRMKGKANLARSLSWQLQTTVHDRAIHGGGPIKGLVEILKSMDQLPQLKVVVIEFPFRQCFANDWNELGRILCEIPWTRQILVEFAQKHPGDQANFEEWTRRR